MVLTAPGPARLRGSSGPPNVERGSDGTWRPEPDPAPWCNSRVPGLAAVLGSALLGAVALIPAGSAPVTWKKLHRPLHLPRLAPAAPCPVSRIDQRVDWERISIFGGSGIGRGPVYPGLGASGGALTASPDVEYGGPWAGGKVFWYVRPSYRGRVLIRGRRLDGPQRLGFNGHRLPARELRIERGTTVSWEGQPPGSRGVPSSVRVRAPGCYGVQIDGMSFSRVVVFQAVLSG